MSFGLSFLAALTAATVTLAPADRGRVVATVGPRTLTLGMVADRLERYPPFARKRFADPEQLEKLVDEILENWVLMAEARARGLGSDPAVLLIEKQVAIEEMKRTLSVDMEALLTELRAANPVTTHEALLARLRFDGDPPRDLGADGALVVAEGPGLAVPLAMLQAYVDSLPPDAVEVVRTDRGLATMVRNAVDFELLAAEAERRGFHLSDAVTLATEAALVEMLLTRAVASVGPVDEAAARAWYAAHIHEFNAPAALRLRRIVAPDKKTAKKWAKSLAGKPAAEWRAIWKTTPEAAGVKDPMPVLGEAFEVGWYTEAGEALDAASTRLSRDPEEPAIPLAAVKAAWKLGGAGTATTLALDGVYWVVGVVAVRPPLSKPFESVRTLCERAALGEMKEDALILVAAEARERTPVRRWFDRLSALRID